MSRAFYICGPRDVRVSPFNLRPAKPNEVLLEVSAVGLCGSDLHYYKDGGIGSAKIVEPFVPGHEFAGRLVDDLPEFGLASGTLVAVDPNDACGHCPHCREGHPNLCPNVEFIGAPPFHGAMTERLWVPKRSVVPLPEGFTAIDAAMLEPLGVAIHAVGLAKPRLMERVALIGCGPIGLLILQVMRVAGAGEILAVDPLAHRRAAAARLGASRTGASVAEIQTWTAGEGAPLVVEATNSPDGMRDAVLAARIGGRVVLVGIPDGGNYTLPASEARRRALKIKFARRMGDVYSQAVALVASRKVDVASLVSHTFSLEDAPEAFRRHADNAPGMLKSIILPNAETAGRA
jgi:L-iditol 2-dehydrogenase